MSRDQRQGIKRIKVRIPNKQYGKDHIHEEEFEKEERYRIKKEIMEISERVRAGNFREILEED